LFREEKTFVLRFSLEARFPENYEGEEDDYDWLKRWEGEIKPEILKSIFTLLRRHPDLKTHVRNRGISAEDEIEIVIEKDFSEI
jgi:hypothetical protein